MLEMVKDKTLYMMKRDFDVSWVSERFFFFDENRCLIMIFILDSK